MPLKIASHGICSECARIIPRIVTPCPLCGLPHSLATNICYRCREDRPDWDTLIAVSAYCNPLKKMMQKVKFDQMFELTFALARLMFLAWYSHRLQGKLEKPDLITCVPLHHLRYWSRGFNQAALLAKPISYWTRCNFQPYLLHRTKVATDQKNLSLSKRQHNVQNLFECSADLTNKSVMLIDDIVTTGSTIKAISRVLKQRGARQVHVLCLCRTLL